MQRLPFYDAVMAVTDVAINSGLQHLFAAAPDRIELDIDPDYGIGLTATMGTPTVQFLANDEVRVTVPIVDGTYEGGVRKNRRTGKEETIKTPLAGSSLSFVVDVAKLRDRRASMHERDFTIQELYLDLTRVRGIDTTKFNVSIEDQDKVASIVNAFVEKLQVAKAAGNGGAPARLTLGEVTVPAVFDPTGSPLLPSHGTFSLTPENDQGGQHATSGDLNFLLMMGGRDLPTDKAAGRFDSPWNVRSADGEAAHDGVLVISDYLLLEAVAVPIMKSLKIPADSIALSRGDSSTPARASLTKSQELQDGVSLTRCEATLDESGRIVLLLRAEKSEPLRFMGIQGVKVIVPQERTITLQIGSDDKGDLSMKVVSDTTTKLDPYTQGDHQLSPLEIAEAVAGVAALIFAGLPLAIDLIVQESKWLSDKDVVAKHLGELDAHVHEAVNQSVELPGSGVFSFGSPRFDGRLLCYDADYIAMPALEAPKAQPFQIGDFPRMGPDGKQTDVRTDPVLVGESIVNYRMVDDPDLTGRQGRENPYYILRREQYWSRCYRKGWPPKEEVTEVASWRIAMSQEDAASMEKTTHMRVTAGCRLAFKDFVSAEVQTEIGNELRMDVETTTRTETEEQHQVTITHQASDTPFTAAVWTIADRFTLCRGDRYPIKTWAYVHGKDLAEVDVSPPADKPTPTHDVTPLTDPTKDEAVAAGAGG